ncbi:hypothetical protein BDK51DRAFT_51544 [Blyttiomyces helicus]|uniref:Protein kinase domain-containing protein n=1 Tax=Blyttiomyces helicus TaxID=388810 RepID=A0A4V1IR15_9FUNG|nr:hypothetical protein BDK51DRAFT_51544 [Blyttiomyces helicus]|eukprot:RKO88477.1 hypothetical protein BDK51DRAFT_51544 [Blyttiomyces helicus]
MPASPDIHPPGDGLMKEKKLTEFGGRRRQKSAAPAGQGSVGGVSGGVAGGGGGGRSGTGEGNKKRRKSIAEGTVMGGGPAAGHGAVGTFFEKWFAAPFRRTAVVTPSQSRRGSIVKIDGSGVAASAGASAASSAGVRQPAGGEDTGRGSWRAGRKGKGVANGEPFVKVKSWTRVMDEEVGSGGSGGFVNHDIEEKLRAALWMDVGETESIDLSASTLKVDQSNENVAPRSEVSLDAAENEEAAPTSRAHIAAPGTSIRTTQAADPTPPSPPAPRASTTSAPPLDILDPIRTHDSLVPIAIQPDHLITSHESKWKRSRKSPASSIRASSSMHSLASIESRSSRSTATTTTGTTDQRLRTPSTTTSSPRMTRFSFGAINSLPLFRARSSTSLPVRGAAAGGGRSSGSGGGNASTTAAMDADRVRATASTADLPFSDARFLRTRSPLAPKVIQGMIGGEKARPIALPAVGGGGGGGSTLPRDEAMAADSTTSPQDARKQSARSSIHPSPSPILIDDEPTQPDDETYPKPLAWSCPNTLRFPQWRGRTTLSMPRHTSSHPVTTLSSTLVTQRSRSVDCNLNRLTASPVPMRARAPTAAVSRERAPSVRRSPTQHTVKETSTIYARHSSPHALIGPMGEMAETQGKVNQYHIMKDIGSGAYGRVVLCLNELDARYYACKIISKSRLRKKFRWDSAVGGGDGLGSIKREVAILKKLSIHRNINALVEVLDDAKEDSLYMIFELCEYGSVMKIDIHKSVHPFSESIARSYFRDVVLGLEYCTSETAQAITPFPHYSPHLRNLKSSLTYYSSTSLSRPLETLYSSALQKGHPSGPQTGEPPAEDADAHGKEGRTEARNRADIRFWDLVDVRGRGGGPRPRRQECIATVYAPGGLRP